jgi:multisubunit Na+/H+ antiporter MnhG subunit
MRKRGRILGTTIGLVVGIAAGGGLALSENGNGAAGLAILIGAPVGGHFIGKSKDRQEVPITVLPG